MVVAFESIPKEFVSEAIFFDYKAPITEVLSKIDREEAVVLIKDKRYYGIIDHRSIAKKGSTKMGKKDSASKFATKVPLLDKETSMAKAIRYFYESGSKALPYAESGKVLGVVKREEILKAILSMHMLSSYKVNEVMSTPVIAIDAEKTIADASSIMRQNRINRIAVLSKNKMLGVVTYNTILRYSGKLTERGSAKLESPTPPPATVKDIVDSDFDSIGHNESIDEAIRQLVEKNTSGLLVVRSGNPVGMISVKDIFEAAIGSNQEATEGILISGIDESTRQYEQDIKDEIEKLVEKLDRFTKMKIDNISVHVRKHKVRNYEINIRLWLAKSGAVSVSSQGYSIEATLKDALTRLYNTVKDKKEIIYMEKRQSDSREEEEEEE